MLNVRPRMNVRTCSGPSRVVPGGARGERYCFATPGSEEGKRDGGSTKLETMDAPVGARIPLAQSHATAPTGACWYTAAQGHESIRRAIANWHSSTLFSDRRRRYPPETPIRNFETLRTSNPRLDSRGLAEDDRFLSPGPATANLLGRRRFCKMAVKRFVLDVDASTAGRISDRAFRR